MNGKTITWVFLTRFLPDVLLGISVTGNPNCRKTQYATLGVEGQVDCVLDGTFDTIQWFFGNGTVPVAQRTKNGTTGTGHNNWDYSVLPTGQLIIRNVTMEKQGHYKVLAITAEDIEVHSVTLIAVDFWRSPMIEVDGCSDNGVCIIKAAETNLVRCFVEIVPPNVHLTAYDPSGIITSKNVTSRTSSSSSQEIRAEFGLTEEQKCSTDVNLYCNKTEVRFGYSSSRLIIIHPDPLRCPDDVGGFVAIGLMFLFFLLVVILVACQVWVARRREKKHNVSHPTMEYGMLLDE